MSEIRLSLVSDNGEIDQGLALTISADKKLDKIFCNYPWGILTRSSLGEESQLGIMEEQIPELRKISTADCYFILNVMNHLKDKGQE